MYVSEDYSDQLLEKVDALASRIALLKSRFAEQAVSVKLEYYWELAHIRSSFAELKWRLEQLDEDDDRQLNRDKEVIELTWQDLMHSVEGLLATLPRRRGPVLLPQNVMPNRPAKSRDEGHMRITSRESR